MNIGSTYSSNGAFTSEAMSVVIAQFMPMDAATMDEVDRNVDTILHWMERAAGGFPGLDLFVSPECGLQGCAAGGKYMNVGLTLDSPQIKRICDKCRELEIWGIFNPLLKPNDGSFITNTAILVNDKGEIVGTYTKTNPWLPNEAFNPGNEIPVFDGPKNSKIGIILCADGDYSETWREAAYNGANVIVRTSHYMAPYDEAWNITNRAGAYFNQCYVVACNAAGTSTNYTYFGKSAFIGPEGNIIYQAPTGIEWLLKADLYPGMIDYFRKQHASYNMLWQMKHRGAASPDCQGIGMNNDIYSAYNTTGNGGI